MNKLKTTHLWIATAISFIIAGLLIDVPFLSEIFSTIFFILLIISIVKTKRSKKVETLPSRDYRETKVSSRQKTFHLRGINYNNRQDNLELLDAGDYLTPRYYEYQGEPAIELFLNDLTVGVVPKELAEELTKLKPTFVVLRVYEFDDGRFGAEIIAE